MTTAAVFNAKPVAYAYDAYEERQKELKRLKEEEEQGLWVGVRDRKYSRGMVRNIILDAEI